MKAVGFKNFRNFEEFPMMPIEGVTFLVGQNNSGKSTFTKAVRLIDCNVANFLRDWSGKSIMERPYIDLSTTCRSFKRALFAGASSGIIELTSKIGYFDVTINVQANAVNPAKGDVCYVKIYDNVDDFSWEYDFEKKVVKWDYSGLLLANILRCRLCSSNRNFVAFHDAETEYLIKMYEGQKERVIKEVETDSFHIFSLGGLMGVTFALDGERLDMRLGNEDNEDYRRNWNIIDNFFRRLRHDINACIDKIVYFPAHESTLKSLFFIGDTMDSTSKVVNEFHFSNEKLKAARRKWINKWLAQFGIGTNFEMAATDEAISVTIVTMQSYSIPLADMGRGAVQIFIALLKVSLLPSDVEWSNLGKDLDDFYAWHPEADPVVMEDEAFPSGWKRYSAVKKISLIFEEPEQNLHPALQSKLADLFADIHKSFGYNVIVETHSEYMIRRTQALIASGEVPFEKNPFHVYYFPQGELPYDMKYTEAGFFEESFDPGFYDTASELTLTVLKGRKS